MPSRSNRVERLHLAEYLAREGALTMHIRDRGGFIREVIINFVTQMRCTFIRVTLQNVPFLIYFVPSSN